MSRFFRFLFLSQFFVSAYAAGACETAKTVLPPSVTEGWSEDQDHVLNIDFKKPVIKRARTFIHITGKRLFRSPSSGSFYTRVSTQELKALFGLEVTVSMAKGAGNAVDTDAYFIEIKNMKSLKKGIKRLVKDLSIEDDPKFSLIDDAVEFIPDR